ncbi:MAG: FtsQ-type POTRA domain-containing protein [Spirochaetes bacterium]|nr:FtsQ-type POTRA domain-containing protein [Spirochaetota bacterium]
MSSTFIRTGLAYNFMDTKKEKSLAPKKKLILFALSIVFILFLIAKIAFQLFIAPELLIRKIEIHCSSTFPLSNNDILRLAELEGRLYYFSINPALIEKRLLAHPLIKTAEVRRVFPASLYIKVTERVPLGMALVNTEGRTIPVVFDEEGVIFEIGRSVSDYRLPVISGLKFTELRLGLRLPQELIPYLAELKRLRETTPALFDQISEIKFVKKNNLSYEVLLYPLNTRVRVRTENTINEALLKQIFVVLDIIEKNGLGSKMDELDFRSGQVVFRVKEG